MSTLLEFREEEWHSADGKCIKIKDLAVGHLTAILNWIKARPKQYPPHIYEKMVREAHYRKLILFVEGDPYPTFNGESWELVDAKTGESFYEPPPLDYLETVNKLGIKFSVTMTEVA